MSNGIAQNILNQLGGRRFTAMTGAKNFSAGDNYLVFALPSNFAKDGINRVKVTLNAMDTYTVRFMKLRGVNLKELGEVENVYCDRLAATFEEKTGLNTRL